MAARAIHSMNELNTTHNTFWDCRMQFLQQPFLKELYNIHNKNILGRLT